MLVAALSAFLWKQPPALQALFVGACSGAFLMGVVSAVDSDPSAGLLVIAFLVFAIANGVFYYVARARSRRKAAEEEPSGDAEIGSGLPAYQLALFVLVWLIGITAALLTLLVGAGFKVAVILVLPIVLFAPVALAAARELRGNRHR